MRTTVDRLPDVYMQESRDFQLLARLWNMIFLGQHRKVKAILQVLDPMTCPDQYLDLLRDRLGFEPTIKIEPRDMRVILKAFPWLIRHKGSIRAVSTAVRIALMLQGIDSSTFGLYINKGNDEIQIFINRDIDTSILEELFRHIAPVGYTFSLSRSTTDARVTTLNGDSVVFVGIAGKQTLSSIIHQPNLSEITLGTPALDDDPAIQTIGYEPNADTWAMGSLGIQEIISATDKADDADVFEAEMDEESKDIMQYKGTGELPASEE